MRRHLTVRDLPHSEIKKLITVLLTADDRCGHCAKELGKEMDKIFPGIAWSELIEKAWNGEEI